MEVLVKPHLHGRLLAARIDILPFFFLKSRRSLTRHKIYLRFSLRDIARHAPKKIKSQQSLTRKRDFTAMLAYDYNSQQSLTRWDCVPVILAKSSRRKSRYRTGSLAGCEIVSKRGLLILNLQKPIAAKALQIHSFSAFALKTITLRNFEQKLYEANASVKRNTRNTIEQLISLKLAMKM